MKSIILMLPLVFSSGVLAQNWVVQTSGTSNNLTSVQFPDGNDTGFAVGGSGVILRTLNGGTTWTTQASGTTHLLNSVYFSDKEATTGYVVGDTGTILKTTNGGSTWTLQTSGTTRNLRFVIGKSGLGWFTGGDSGTILTNISGGATWASATSGTTANIYAGAGNQYGSANAVVLWAVGASGGVKSLDTGKTWSPLFSPLPTVSLYGVALDSTTSIAVGAGGTILKTTNGGSTWPAITSGTTQTLNGLFASSTNNNVISTGYVVGNSGTILYSLNGGVTWASQSSPTSQALNGVTMPSGASTYAVYAVGNGGVIMENTVPPSSIVIGNGPEEDGFGVAMGSLWYELPTSSHVQALVFDAQGKLVLKMIDAPQSGGYHEMPLPTRFLEQTSATYFLQFLADGFQRSIRLQSQ